MKRCSTVGLVLALCMAASIAWGVMPADQGAYEVPLPLEMTAPTYVQLSQADALKAIPGWAAFRSARGAGWFVAQYRTDLGMPSALIGPSFQLVDEHADEATVREVAGRFLGENVSVLKADMDELGAPDVLFYDGRYQLTYGQTYQGLEVVGGRVELYVDHGKLVLMGSEFFPNVRVQAAPGISAEQASASAVSGMPFNPVSDGFDGTPRLVVYPLIQHSVPSYYLAYEVKFKTRSPVGYWWTYVDASDGQILSRINYADTYDIPVTELSDTQLNYAQDPYTQIPGRFQWVNANSTDYYTDTNGYVDITVPLNQNYLVQSQLRGRYCNVNRQDGSDASFTGPGTPGTPLTITWTDANSQPSERDAYYSVNRVHDWLKSVDPTFTNLDYAISTNVNIYDATGCNAYWNGSSINFYSPAGGCVNMAQVSDVVMHEYSHAITQYTYSPQAPPNSSGMGEAFSDITAQTITNDVLMGRGIYNGTGYIRTGQNDRQYPGTECGGEVHCLGEILMGSMWRTRVNLINTYGYDAAKALYDRIWRAAWKTKQANMPNFLTRLLMADDNNANLADGTPDWWDICDAFATHNLPCPTISQYISFTHTPLADQSSTTNPYEVVSLIQPISCGTLLPDSIRVYYSVNAGQTWAFAGMTPTGITDQYHAYIPAQSCGTLVNYYIWAKTSTGATGTEPARAPGHATHVFMTGPVVVALNDDFEQDRGWTIGAPGDAAVDGIWERADPNGKTDPYNNQVVQPEDDHTSTGVNCFVTNAAGGYYTNHDVDGGATTILSPVYNWPNNAPAAAKISFWAFFANETVVDDTLRCSVSNDGGASWIDLVTISGQTGDNGPNQWLPYVGYFTNANIPFTNQMRFRFQIADYNASLTEGAVDDVVIKYSNCTGIDAAGEHAGIPTEFRVEPSRPNPARDGATIRYALPRPGQVRVDLFDAGGRVIRTLANGSMPAGYHSVAWDGRDGAGRRAAAGMYYYRVLANGQEQTSKVMMVR